MTRASRLSIQKYAAPLAVVAIVLLVAAIRWRLAPAPLERDEGEYAYAGQLILQGVPPYQLEYNMKFPGTYYAYAALLAIFGQTPTGVRVGLIVINAATIWLLFAIGRRLISTLGGVVAACVFAVMSVDRLVMGVFAHASHFVLVPMLAGLLVLLRALASARARTFVFAGALFGVALLMKQPGAAFLGVAAMLVLWPRATWRRRLIDLSLVVGGAVAPMALMVGVLWFQGALGRFWFWTFQYARQYVSEIPITLAWPSFRVQLHMVTHDNLWLWLLGAAGFVTLWMTPFTTRTRVALIGLSVFSFVAISPGWYFRPHYFILLLPAVSLFTGVLVESVRHWLRRRPPALAASMAVALVVAAASAYVMRAHYYLLAETPLELNAELYSDNPFAEAVSAGSFLADHTSPTDVIAVVGSEPEIYFYANRRSATGYVYTYGLMEPQPFASTMQAEMMNEIESRQPKYLIGVWAPFSWISRAESEARILIWLARYADRCYDPAQTMGPLLTIFVRKSDAPCTAGADPPPFDNQPLSYERLETYRKVQALEPTLASRLIARGRKGVDDGNMPAAMAYFAEAVRFDPTSAPAHYNLAVALITQHRPAEAMSEFRETLRLDPSLADAHSNLSNLLSDAGALDEALMEIMSAIRLDPNRPDLHFNAAVVFYRRHDLPHVLEQLRAALAIDANFAPARQMYDQLTHGR